MSEDDDVDMMGVGEEWMAVGGVRRKGGTGEGKKCWDFLERESVVKVS